MSNAIYQNIKSVSIILADDICSMINNHIIISTDFSANNTNLSMDYVNYFKQHTHITNVLHLRISGNNLIYNHSMITQKQLLNVLRAKLGLNHHKSHVQSQSLF